MLVNNFFADFVIHNASIITLDPARPAAEALAARAGRIIALGSDREVLACAGPRTVVVNARGLCVLPGFNDNHIHLLGMGNFFRYPNLFGQTEDEIIASLKKYYLNPKPGTLIRGYAWDYTTCLNPRKELLDRAFPHNPVILRQYSGHAVWVNSRVLAKIVKKKKHDPDSTGGIVLDNDGRPTGVIRGTIVHKSHRKDLLSRVLNVRLHGRLVKNALERLARAGITSAQDNTWQPATVWLLAGLRSRGLLTCRLSCWAFGHYRLLEKSMAMCPYDPLMVRRGPVKYIVDGAFSPHTAWLVQPYLNEGENYGQAVLDPAALCRIVRRAAGQKKQPAFHAIGDRAVHEVVNAVEKAARTFPIVRRLRIRLEHAQLILPGDIRRIRDLGMLVAAQPTALAQPDRDLLLLGRERFERVYPYGSLLKNGVHLSFGSDIPGEIEYNPFVSIYRAVSRRGLETGTGAYAENEALTVRQALECYTTGSAYAEFMEHSKGRLAVGKLADFIVLSDNPLATQIENLPRIQVLMTVVGARIVYGAL